MESKQIPKNVRLKVYEKYNGHCGYCGCKLEPKNMQVDHVIPVYGKNGTNEIDNYMPSCRMCNFYKGTFSLEDFRKRLKTIHYRLEKQFIYRIAKKYGLVEEHKENIKFYFEKVEEMKNE